MKVEAELTQPPDTERVPKLWVAVIVLAALVSVVVLLVDRKIKADIIAESVKLRVLIDQENTFRQEAGSGVGRGTDAPADEADRGGDVAGDLAVGALDDDPGTSQDPVADADPADGASMGGESRVPHRGAIDAS